MGQFATPTYVTDDAVHRAILLHLLRFTRNSVVSCNAIMIQLRLAGLGRDLPDQRLAQTISAAALELGQVPVFDPSRPTRPQIESETRTHRSRLGAKPVALSPRATQSALIRIESPAETLHSHRRILRGPAGLADPSGNRA